MTRLADRIRRGGTIPDEAKADPWYDGGIILISSDNYAFKYFRYLLVLKAPFLADKLNLHHLSDDNVELVDDCPFFELPDKAKDLSSFLTALLDQEEIPYVPNSFHPVLPFLTVKLRTLKVLPWARRRRRNSSAVHCVCRQDTKSPACAEKFSVRLRADIQAHFQHGTAFTTLRTAQNLGNRQAPPFSSTWRQKRRPSPSSPPRWPNLSTKS